MRSVTTGEKIACFSAQSTRPKNRGLDNPAAPAKEPPLFSTIARSLRRIRGLPIYRRRSLVHRITSRLTEARHVLRGKRDMRFALLRTQADRCGKQATHPTEVACCQGHPSPMSPRRPALLARPTPDAPPAGNVRYIRHPPRPFEGPSPLPDPSPMPLRREMLVTSAIPPDPSKAHLPCPTHPRCPSGGQCSLHPPSTSALRRPIPFARPIPTTPSPSRGACPTQRARPFNGRNALYATNQAFTVAAHEDAR